MICDFLQNNSESKNFKKNEHVVCFNKYRDSSHLFPIIHKSLFNKEFFPKFLI